MFFTNYGYANIGTTKATTNLVGEITQKYGSDELAKYQYIYDGNGNIEQVRENGVVTAKYTYDELNQLVWSGDRNTNLYTQMVYDNAGNITRVDIYSLGSNWAPVKLLESRTYTYGDTNWCDKLTGYNGTTITYDAVGNPLSYRDGMTMSWQNGRQLASLQTADNSVTYKYDNNGMRTRKSDSNGTTNYYYDSSNNLIGLTKGNNTLLFYYNPIGEVTSFKYNSEMYYYIKNLQGDIVKIIDQSGAEAASYKYDSWGKITAESGDSVIRELNPFRYRGYVYDTETGLYYLQSRYYDPITGRFLNADVYCDTQTGSPLSTNMFAYCENNSISNVDPKGFAPKTLEGYVKKLKNKTVFGNSVLKISIKGNNITIFVSFIYYGDLLYKKRYNKTYKEIFNSGIKKYWKGNYKIHGYKVKLSTIFSYAARCQVVVKMYNKLGVSNVSRLYRNWTYFNHGVITMYKGDSRTNTFYSTDQFERVAAHEFGHVLGLDDLYNKSQRIINKYSYIGNYSMMGHQWQAPHINNYDLERVLYAFMNNKSKGWY